MLLLGAAFAMAGFALKTTAIDECFRAALFGMLSLGIGITLGIGLGALFGENLIGGMLGFFGCCPAKLALQGG